jgi:hypothetical protein
LTLFDLAHQVGVRIDEPGRDGTTEAGFQLGEQLLQPGRIVAVDLARLGRNLEVRFDEQPLRRPLEQRQPGDPVDHGRDDLDGGRPGADHAEAAAVDLDRVVPPGTVEHRALERVLPGELGDVGMVQNSGGGDDDVDGVAVPGGRFDPPPSARPLAACHFLPEADVRQEPEPLGGADEVRLDLVAGRESPAPVGVEGERIGVDVGGHVAGDPGIRVLAPGAAQPVGLLVDGEVAQAGLLQPDPGQDARHAAADDRQSHAGQDRRHLLLMSIATTLTR